MANSFVTPWTTLTSGSPIFVLGFIIIFWAITYTKYSFPLCKIKIKMMATYRTIVSVKQDKVCKVTFLLLLSLSPTLFHPMDYSLPGSSVREISQARILEWVAISYFGDLFYSRDGTHISYIAGRFFTAEPSGMP